MCSDLPCTASSWNHLPPHETIVQVLPQSSVEICTCSPHRVWGKNTCFELAWITNFAIHQLANQNIGVQPVYGPGPREGARGSKGRYFWSLICATSKWSWWNWIRNCSKHWHGSNHYFIFTETVIFLTCSFCNMIYMSWMINSYTYCIWIQVKDYFHFKCRPMLVHGMILVCFLLCHKMLGNLRDLFGQMVHPPLLEKIPFAPMNQNLRIRWRFQIAILEFSLGSQSPQKYTN